MKIVSQSIGCEVGAERSNEKIGACDPAEIVSLLPRHGWISFSGFDVSVAEFEEFTARFGDCADTRTVHYPPGGEGLGFHAEDAYNPYRPDTLWFLCVFEGSDGGAPTRVVDGVRLLDELDERWQGLCRDNDLRFDRQWSADLWRDAVGRDSRDELDAVLTGIPGVEHVFLDNDDLYASYRTPIVTRTPIGQESFSNTMLQAITEPPFYGMSLGDGSPVPQELADTVQRDALRMEEQINWVRGQVAVIDNLRMMHRRSGYSGKDRDLRARHCENFYGTKIPPVDTPVAVWAKSLIQGDEGYPSRVGPLPRPAA